MSEIVVINSAASITPKTQEGPSAYTDLVGSGPSAPHPIVAGVWDLVDIDAPTPAWEAEWDEMKYLAAGQLTLKDETTGAVTEAETGSIIWIPKGAKMSIVRSKGVRVIYVEQQYRKAQYTA
ncbi:hypothetical protein BJX68DRAFT_264097 [Aspergillus pseudodeflectus]|uniref:(S)-ureidoglycine aminohydrolase cupin domain-containing protein n=1 Tax=Aspergillus pseudodeflectus TaxID=176178 RepID=A0ABR4KWZ0_9EURO